MSFKSDEQIRRVADALCRRAGLPAWWSAGEVGAAVAFLASGEGRSSQEALVGLALACWNGHGEIPLSRLLALDGDNLAAVGRLLVALATPGGRAVDAWLELELEPGSKELQGPPPEPPF